jgi:DNA helicase-2/ATP-dependent DNA helicase PcrA
VKTILDYLRTISQPDNNDALSRIINTPSRRIGDATIKGLLEEADILKITLWSLILGIVRGQKTTKVKLPKQTEQSLSTFVNIILTARKKCADSEQQSTIVQLIQFVIDKTNYENWLEEHHADANKGRWDNVQELITQASDFESLIATGYEDDSLPEIGGLEQDGDSDVLSKFLANVTLASEVKDRNEGVSTAQVTISTIHAAKGLEWPIVFIPGAYQGSIPHSRAEDSNEERRLLYVAMTRAKALLYMSFPIKNSQGENSTLSPFLEPPSLAPLLNERGPSLRSSTIQTIAQILRRPLPSAESISKSSCFLRSAEDDLFPINDNEEETREEFDWHSGAGKPTFTKGQRAPTRKRVELGRSTSLIEQGCKASLGSTYPTTMDRASSFKASSVAVNTTFVSAGSHLQALKEESVNCVVAISEELNDKNEPPKAMRLSGKTTKDKDGQVTLFSFLGKADPQVHKRPAPRSEELEPRKIIKTSFQPLGMSRDINTPRQITHCDESTAIAPALANHRLVAMQNGSRPKQAVHSQEHRRNDYVFLSSSPPRQMAPVVDSEEIPEKPPGLTAKPALLPLIRPATTMHTTTVSITQNSLGSKRTLGVKRSMNGWSSGNGRAFRPPTMRRHT